MKRYLALVLALSACTAEKDKPDVDDTAVGTDDTADSDTDIACETSVLGIYSGAPYTPPRDDPEAPPPALDGATGVYYRDPIEVSFFGDGAAATITLADAGGGEVAFDTEWTTGNVQAILSTVLAADTTYVLRVDVCGVTTTSTFTTSSLGAPLTVSADDMVGRAFVWRLSEATITEPAPLAFVADAYLTVPLLISVTAASATEIDLLGGLGYIEDDGSYTQVMSEATWDFPAGAFAEAPYFEAYAEYITLSYDGTPIPIEQFSLSGTFTADGTAIERGVGSGFGDTRSMGVLLNQPDNPNAVCEIATGAGVACVPCADGEPYCLHIVAEEITGEWEEGLTMVPVD